MDKTKFSFDDPFLSVGSGPISSLSEAIFGLYRQLAKAGEAAMQERERLKKEAEEACGNFRRRLANVSAEVFHLRKCVATVNEPMRRAGLEKNVHSLEVLVEKFDHTLDRNGVQVLSLNGRALDDQLYEIVEVIASVPTDTAVARVRETIEPLVIVEGQMVLFPKVIKEVPISRDE